MPRPAFLRVILVTVLLVAAGAADARLAANRLAANRLAANRLAANRLAANRLAANRLAAGSFTMGDGASDMLATDEARELLAFIVSCALPEDVTLTATASDGTEYQFFGELGLVRSWLKHPLSRAGRGWISACLLARVNDHAVPVPFSMRGPNRGLATTPDEEAAYTLEEGAFYGDLFVPEPDPQIENACQGRDQATQGEIGGLVDRDCAEPESGDPAHTQCGFDYTGECGDFADPHACKRFSRRGFYVSCVDAARARKFRQVITTFVAP